MPIQNVTENWQMLNGVGGVYILRSHAHPDIVRIGAGGVNGGVGGLAARLWSLTVPWPGQQTCGTHFYQPFEVLRAWALDGWDGFRLGDAEMCVYRAFFFRFRRPQGPLPDRSLFHVIGQPGLEQLFDRVSGELERLESIGIN